MFIFLFYLLLNMKLTFSTIIIQNAGVYDIRHDDIAMIFYLTVENSFDHDTHVTVCFVKCLEGDPYAEAADHMYLLGGDMGYLPSKSTTNLTLIYPNLYLRNRIGKCLLTLHYDTDQTTEEMRKEVYFNTNQCLHNEEQQSRCDTCDLDEGSECGPVDCAIKYSSRKSFFNKESRLCQFVPLCPPNTVYNPKSNTCRKLHAPVCKSDLELIENGIFEKCHIITNLVHFECHHGFISNSSGVCVCNDGWSTSTCSEGAYHPALNTYHMCNIELNSWERANKQKLIMTTLVILILAVAIAAKMLIAVCILNWCCHFIKSRNNKESNEIFCPYHCGDELCVEESDGREVKSRTIRVSFSNIDGTSSGGETDVTVSADSKLSQRGSRSTIGSCHCDKK